MNKVNVKIHSIIDVITNSSTEVFVMAGESSRNVMFELLGEMLKLTGVDVNPKELFDIKFKIDYYDDVSLLKYYIAQEVLNLKGVKFIEYSLDDDYPDKVHDYFQSNKKELYDLLYNNEILFNKPIELENINEARNVSLIIKPKEGYENFEKLNGIMHRLINTFHIEERFVG